MYHLKKMQDAGIVTVSSTGKNTKSHDMKYYTIDKFAIVILPSGLSEKAKSSKSLHNSFNRIYRFATIGGAALATWFSSQFIQHQQAAVYESPSTANSMMKAAPEMAQKSLSAPTPEVPQAAHDAGIQMYQTTTGEPTTDIYLSIIITLGVVVVGLIIERIIRARRK
jgi:PKD repeat protein